MPAQFTSQDALIVVDVQNDFCPGGSLAVEEGDHVVGVLNDWIDAARRAGVPVYASRDWHPRDHVSFKERGGQWPPHCIQGTSGAELHPALELPDDATVLDKGTERDRDAYSAFDGTGLADRLRSEGVTRIWVGGLAQDVCVRATVLDGIKEGFAVHLIADATRPVTEAGGREALKEMADAGAVIEEPGS